MKLDNLKHELSEYKKVNSLVVDDRSELAINFVECGDIFKINVLDNIINTAKDVFGPAGGLYVNYSKSVQTGNRNASKSKDGNNFFNSIEFGLSLADGIFSLIKQQTDYITGSNKQTSKDGTTSLAMVSSCISKMLLLQRSLGKFKLPSTIYNILFDIVIQEGSKLLDKYKYLTYDENKLDFVEGGMENIANTVNTSVNNNPIFKPAFEKLMKDCVENKINMLDMGMEMPMYKNEEPGIEFDVLQGISAVMTDLNKMNSKSYKVNNNLVFIFDGFTESDFVSSIYIRLLYNFINKTIWEIADDSIEGVFMVFTRTPEYLIKFIEPYNSAQSISCPVSKYTPKEKHGKKLTFRAMIFDDTQTARERFEDIAGIFEESVVDLTKFNIYVKEKLGEKYTPKETEAIVKANPQFIADKIEEAFMIKKPLTAAMNLTEDYDMFKQFFGYVDEETGEFVKLNKLGEVVPVKKENLISDITFNGYDVGLSIKSDDIKQRTIKAKDNVKEILESVRSANAITDDLKYRLDKLSSCKIQPILSFRSQDEQVELMTLLEDALGVFISSICHGVTSGGNTFFLKHIEELKESCNKEFERFFKDVDLSEAKLDLYKTCLNTLVDNIYMGYVMSYRFICEDETDDEFNQILSDYKDMTDKESVIKSYNVITGKYSNKILEASRTTLDVFRCSLSIAKDLLTVRRLNVMNANEYSSMKVYNNAKSIHKLNETFLEK